MIASKHNSRIKYETQFYISVSVDVIYTCAELRRAFSILK